MKGSLCKKLRLVGNSSFEMTYELEQVVGSRVDGLRQGPDPAM